MRLCIAVVLMATALPSKVLAFCYEPSVPYCAERYGQFDDEWEFNSCKNDMESYKSDVERYLSCRNSEAQEAIDDAKRDNDDAISKYNDAIESFNQRARQ